MGNSIRNNNNTTIFLVIVIVIHKKYLDNFLVFKKAVMGIEWKQLERIILRIVYWCRRKTLSIK